MLRVGLQSGARFPKVTASIRGRERNSLSNLVPGNSLKALRSVKVPTHCISTTVAFVPAKRCKDIELEHGGRPGLSKKKHKRIISTRIETAFTFHQRRLSTVLSVPSAFTLSTKPFHTRCTASLFLMSQSSPLYFSAQHNIRTTFAPSFSLASGRRYLNTAKNSSTDRNNVSNVKSKLHEGEKDIVDKGLGTSAAGEAGVAARAKQKIGEFVDNVSTRMPETWNMSDFYAITGAFLFLTALVVGPIMARYMRTSDTKYEIDDDDPVAHIDQIVKEEVAAYVESAINDGKTGVVLYDQTGELITGVVQSQSNALQKAISELLAEILHSEPFKTAAHKLLKELWTELVNDPETTTQVVQLLNNAIKTEEIRKSVQQLLLQLIRDEEFFQELIKLINKLGQDEKVQDATQALLTESAHNALDDPQIRDHSMQFATDVVGDDVVQRTSGEALRNTVSYAVRPGLSASLTIVGVTLLFISLSALGRAGSDEAAAAVIDRGIASVGDGIIRGVAMEEGGTIFAALFAAISGCVAAITSVASFPFRMFRRTINGIANAGKATYRGTANTISSIISLPGNLYRGIRNCIARGWTSVFSEISRSAAALGSFVQEIFVGGFSRMRSGLTYRWTHLVNSISNELSNSVSAFPPFANRCLIAVSSQIAQLVENTGPFLYSYTRRCITTITAASQSIRPLLSSLKLKCARILNSTRDCFGSSFSGRIRKCVGIVSGGCGTLYSSLLAIQDRFSQIVFNGVSNFAGPSLSKVARQYSVFSSKISGSVGGYLALVAGEAATRLEDFVPRVSHFGVACVSVTSSGFHRVCAGCMHCSEKVMKAATSLQRHILKHFLSSGMDN